MICETTLTGLKTVNTLGILNVHFCLHLQSDIFLVKFCRSLLPSFYLTTALLINRYKEQEII